MVSKIGQNSFVVKCLLKQLQATLENKSETSSSSCSVELEAFVRTAPQKG